MKPISPWKTDHELLPDNFLLAKTQLVHLVNRLKKDPVVLKTYDNIKKPEEAEGIIEEPTTILKPPGEVHYPPHHPITRPITPLFDQRNLQLNYVLFTTPRHQLKGRH